MYIDNNNNNNNFKNTFIKNILLSLQELHQYNKNLRNIKQKSTQQLIQTN